MSSGSYTIALSSPPCDALDWSLAIQAIPSIDQEFSVLQTFQAGVAVAGPALLSGIVTFEQSPVFEQGITVPSELNLGALTVSGLSTLSGGLACAAPAVFSDSVSCASSLSVAGDISNAGSLSTARLTVRENGADITGDIFSRGNLSTVQLTVRENGASIGGDIFNAGDLSTVRLTVRENGATIAGDIYNAGDLSTVKLTVRENGADITGDIYTNAYVSAAALVVRELGASIVGPVEITGSLHATADAVLDAALSVSGAVSVAGALMGAEATFSVLSCASEVVDGVASFGGLVSANAGLSVAGPLIFPESQVALSPGGVVSVDLAGASSGFFLLAMTSNITGFAFSGMRVNASFSIFLTVGASPKIMSKALSTEGCTCYNDLAGATSMSAFSLWCIKGVVVSESVTYLEFLNVT